MDRFNVNLLNAFDSIFLSEYISFAWINYENNEEFNKIALPLLNSNRITHHRQLTAVDATPPIVTLMFGILKYI